MLAPKFCALSQNFMNIADVVLKLLQNIVLRGWYNHTHLTPKFRDGLKKRKIWKLLDSNQTHMMKLLAINYFHKKSPS